MKALTIAFASLLAAAVSPCQSIPGPPVSAKTDPWAQLPEFTLNFAHPVGLAGLPQSPFLVDPLQCSPNGTAFLQIPLAPKFTSRTLAYVTRRGEVTSNTFGTDVPGYNDLRQIAWFPGDKYIYGLVEGRRQGGDEAQRGRLTRPPWKEFVFRYGLDGSLQSATPLEISFLPSRLAVLGSGRLIVMGEDTINHSPHLVMLDGDGANPRPLDVFGSGLYGVEELGRFYPGMGNDDEAGSAMGRVVSSAQFVSHGENVVLVQQGTSFPLVEIGESGILRTVRLNLPRGITIESLVPSSAAAWLVRVVDHRATPETRSIVAFDPDSGEALREISIAGLATPESVACESDGVFLGFRKDFEKGSDTGTWNLMTAPE